MMALQRDAITLLPIQEMARRAQSKRRALISRAELNVDPQAVYCGVTIVRAILNRKPARIRWLATPVLVVKLKVLLESAAGYFGPESPTETPPRAADWHVETTADEKPAHVDDARIG